MQDSGRHNNFDAIRLFAAVVVMVSHIRIHLELPMSTLGQSVLGFVNGVTVFFIISGFLATGSYLRCPHVSQYALNRCLRIYPGLWANLAVILCLMAAGGTLIVHVGDVAFWAWIVTLFSTGSDAVAGTLFPAPIDTRGFYKEFPSGVLWTIPIELGFYILAPLIFMFRRSLIMIAACCASIGFALLNHHLLQTQPGSTAATLLLLSPLPYLWIFMLGGLARIFWDRIQTFFIGRAALWLLAYSAIVFTVPMDRFLPQNIDLGIILRTTVMCGLVLSVAYTAKNASAWLKWDLSYGIYLFHMPIIYTLKHYGISGRPWLWVAVPLLTILAATLSWLLVERRALRLKHRIRWPEKSRAVDDLFSRPLP